MTELCSIYKRTGETRWSLAQAHKWPKIGLTTIQTIRLGGEAVVVLKRRDLHAFEITNGPPNAHGDTLLLPDGGQHTLYQFEGRDSCTYRLFHASGNVIRALKGTVVRGLNV